MRLRLGIINVVIFSTFCSNHRTHLYKISWSYIRSLYIRGCDMSAWRQVARGDVPRCRRFIMLKLLLSPIQVHGWNDAELSANPLRLLAIFGLEFCLHLKRCRNVVKVKFWWRHQSHFNTKMQQNRWRLGLSWYIYSWVRTGDWEWKRIKTSIDWISKHKKTSIGIGGLPQVLSDIKHA